MRAKDAVMYIITCRTDDTLVICSPEGELTVTVVSVQGEKARLGIEAPPHVPVHRGEVFLAIQSAGTANASPAAARWADADRRRQAEFEAHEAEPGVMQLELSPAQRGWLDRLAEQLADTTDPGTRKRPAAERSQLLLRLLDACIALDEAHEAEGLLSRLDAQAHAPSPSPKPRKAR